MCPPTATRLKLDMDLESASSTPGNSHISNAPVPLPKALQIFVYIILAVLFTSALRLYLLNFPLHLPLWLRDRKAFPSHEASHCDRCFPWRWPMKWRKHGYKYSQLVHASEDSSSTGNYDELEEDSGGTDERLGSEYWTIEDARHSTSATGRGRKQPKKGSETIGLGIKLQPLDSGQAATIERSSLTMGDRALLINNNIANSVPLKVSTSTRVKGERLPQHLRHKPISPGLNSSPKQQELSYTTADIIIDTLAYVSDRDTSSSISVSVNPQEQGLLLPINDNQREGVDGIKLPY